MAGRALAIAYFKLFDNCNLKCRMCECWELPMARLSLRHYLGMLQRVVTAAPATVRFTGGEPLLFPALTDLLRAASAAGVRTSMITNGKLLDRCLDRVVVAGLQELVVSLDGPREVHHAIRGGDGYDELRAAMLRRPAALTLGVNTVVQRANIDLLDEILGMLTDLPTPPAWWHLIPVRDEPAMRPTAPQVAEFRWRHDDLAALCAEAGITLVADAGMFDQETGSCDVPDFAVYVDAVTGDVYGCNMLAYADAPIGNIVKATLADVLRRDAAMALRSRCRNGVNAACARCDPSSRAMNQALRVGVP